MGQKTNPILLRMYSGTAEHTRPQAKWYASPNQFSKALLSDIKAREYLEKNYAQAGISKILIERTANTIHLIIRCARPGLIIGKKGADVELLKHKLMHLLQERVQLTVSEVKTPDVDAKVIADSIAQQLERRVLYRKAMKRAIQSAMRAGAQGIKVRVSGRLGGAEIARDEKYRAGRVPLHTLRANISYSTSRAQTTYGVLGVQVWIYHGDTIEQD